MKQEQKPTEIGFKETEHTLTLGDESVLTYRLTTPTFDWNRRDARLLQRYYTHFFSHVEARWQKKCYIDACQHLLQQRERSHDPTLFQCSIVGQGTFIQTDFLSLRFDLTELRGTGTPIHIRHCDLWDLTHVVPVSLKGLMDGRFWHKTLLSQVKTLLEQGQESGQFTLYDDWQSRLRQHHFGNYFHLTEQGLVLYFPQYTIAPTSDILSIPLGWDAPIKAALRPVPAEA